MAKIKRHFGNFLKAYHDYAVDGFTPSEFHFWAGISIVAGALERKCYLPFNNGYQVFPNLYVLLVADPGIGKSAAGRKSVVDLLMNLENINCVPSQNSEAKLIDLMSVRQKFFRDGFDQTQCAGYLFASEASNSLKEINGGGDLKPLFTDFYDCPTSWEKATMSAGKLSLKNVCFNILAGCTFEYLKRLVPESEIRGGFASRVIYVLHTDKHVRVPTWLDRDTDRKADSETRTKLFSDLKKIHDLSGEFKWGADFTEAFNRDFAGFEEERIKSTNDNQKSLLARRHLNIIKLAMILSVSQDDELVLTAGHWDIAKGMLAEVERKYDKVLTASSSGGFEVQNSLNESIREAIAANPGANMSALKAGLVMQGNDSNRVNSTLVTLINGGVVKVVPGGGLTYTAPRSSD